MVCRPLLLVYRPLRQTVTRGGPWRIPRGSVRVRRGQRGTGKCVQGVKRHASTRIVQMARFGGQIINFPSILTAGKRSAYGLRKWISSPRREKKVNAGEKNQSAYRPLSYLPDQTSLKTIRKRGQTGLRPVKHIHTGRRGDSGDICCDSTMTPIHPQR